jgi:hypothetical protein
MSSTLPTPTIPPAELASVPLPAVEFTGFYPHSQRSFCVKILDDGKPIVINGWQQKFDFHRVVLDTKKTQKDTIKKIFIDNKAGVSWLRELIMMVDSRPDLRIQHFPPTRFGFGQIIIEPRKKSDLPMSFFDQTHVTCITIQYKAK